MKKIVLSVPIILCISAYFVATQPITPSLAFVSSSSVLFFALPTYMAVYRLTGKSKAILLLTALGVYALCIESTAIKTGIPYGHFVYKDVLGNKIFGLTPWTVAFAYPPIVFASYWLARRICTSTLKILIITALLCTAIDLVLDPAAVKLGFWYWYGGGFFYNVPLVNFIGWMATSFVAAMIIHRFLRNKKLPVSITHSGILIVWFWLWVNIYLAQILPSLVGMGLLFVYYKNSKASRGILNQ